MNLAELKSCTCPHSLRAHRRGTGRCLVESCGCLFGPAPVPDALRKITRPKTVRSPSQRSKLETLLEHRMELAGLPTPVKQFYWARSEKRMYRSDFAYPDAMLLLEVQGGIWAADPGRHNRGSGYEADLSRANLAVLLGYRLLCFSEKMIRSGEAVASIKRALIPREIAGPEHLFHQSGEVKSPHQLASPAAGHNSSGRVAKGANIP